MSMKGVTKMGKNGSRYRDAADLFDCMWAYAVDIGGCEDKEMRQICINRIEQFVSESLASRPSEGTSEDEKVALSFLEGMKKLSDWQPTIDAYALCIRLISRPNATVEDDNTFHPKPMAMKEGVHWSIDELAVQMQVCFTSYKLKDGSYGYFFDIEQCKKILNDIVAPNAGIPEGWKLVPKVLTEEMRDVAAHISDGPDVTYQEHWDQMLDAATQPPATHEAAS